MPKIPYTKLYTADWLTWRRKLPPETLCEILDAISDYCAFGENPRDNLRDNLRDNPRVIEVIDTIMKWTTACERSYTATIQNGKKGGRPKNPSDNPQDNPRVKLNKTRRLQPEPDTEINTETEIKEKNIKKKTEYVKFLGERRLLGLTAEQWARYQKHQSAPGVMVKAIDILEGYAVNNSKKFKNYKDLEIILTRNWAFEEAQKKPYSYPIDELRIKDFKRVGLL